MRNRTRVIATAAVAVALAAGSTAAAVAAPTGGKPSAPAAAKTAPPAKRPSAVKTPPSVKTPSAVKTPLPDNGLADLAAKLGVTPARLDQALRTVKSSLGASGTAPAEDQFTAALARVLGIPVARVRQAFPAGAPGGSKAAKDKKPGGNGSGTANPALDSALAAAVARELHVSTARVSAALRPLLAAGRADPSSPAFAAAARSLGVSSQQLTTALVNAKMSLAKAGEVAARAS